MHDFFGGQELLQFFFGHYRTWTVEGTCSNVSLWICLSSVFPCRFCCAGGGGNCPTPLKIQWFVHDFFWWARTIPNFFWTLQDLGNRRHLLKCFRMDLHVQCFSLLFLLCRGGELPNPPPKNPMVCPLGCI